MLDDAVWRRVEEAARRLGREGGEWDDRPTRDDVVAMVAALAGVPEAAGALEPEEEDALLDAYEEAWNEARRGRR